MKKLNFKLRSVILTTLMMWGAATMAQTSILSETFEGGSGTTLSNWTIVNGSETNQWYIGTATANGGSKSAYITNDNGSSNSYDGQSSSTVHFYRNVNLPTSSSYVLTFDWKADGELDYDDLQVFLVDATYTPTAGTELTDDSYQPLVTCVGYSTWQQAIIPLPASANTKRLVFSWRNDGSVEGQPPAAIDNVSITSYTPIPATINLATAGTLKNESNIKQVNNLTLTGNVDARDIQFMRDSILLLSELNMSGATIIAYSGQGGTYYGDSVIYPANEMPGYSFCNPFTGNGKTSLTLVQLPTGVISIGDGAFRGCNSLSSITIPSGVTAIGYDAFAFCSDLTSLSIPNSVTTIGDAAFYNCSGLTGTLTIPNSVTTIEGYTFYNCYGLSSLIIGNSVTTIEDGAFNSCSSLTSITIPSSVTTIGDNAFAYCYSLTSITNRSLTPQDITYKYVFDGVDPNSCSLTVPTSALTLYQNAAIWNDFLSVTGGGILLSARAKNPVLGSVSSSHPEGLYPAGTSVTLTASPLSGLNFLGWESNGNGLGTTNPFNFTLTKDTIIIAHFGKQANYNSATAGTLKNQTGIKTVTHLTVTGNIDARDVQFMRDSIPLLSELNLSGATIVTYSGVEGTVYGYDTIYPANEMPLISFLGLTGNSKTSLIAVTMPNSITSIGALAFYGCSGLTSIIIPNLVTTIEDNAFSACNGLTSVTIGNSVTTIGNYAFGGCHNLGSIIIPNSVTTIGDHAFSSCNNLTSVTIGNSVTTIGGNAFIGCYSITEMYVKAVNPPSVGYDAFYSIDYTIPVYVPCGNAAIYLADPEWSYFTNITGNIPYSITLESNNAIMGTANITQANTCASTAAIILATSYTGYRFVQWSDGNTNNPRTIAVTSDTAFTAVFSAVTPPGMHNVVVLADGTITGTVTGDGQYAVNTSATITAIPNVGFRFLQWNDSVTTNPRTITVTSDTLFIAYFEAIKFRITVQVNNPAGGSVSGGGIYSEYGTATLTAIPNANYRFLQWDDGNTQNPRTIIVTQAMTYTAIFAADIPGMFYVLGLSNDTTMGTVTGSGDYSANGTATLTPTPKTGYRFVRWDDGNTDNPRAITVTSDTTFTALFSTVAAPGMHNVILLVSGTGMGTVTGDGQYAVNTTATITATANAGYRFTHWNDNVTTNPRTITVTSDTLFTAYFEVIKYMITVQVNNPAGGSVSGGGEYNANTPVTLTAIPNANYRFLQWDDGNTQNPRTIIVTQAMTYTAIFAADIPGMFYVLGLSNDTTMGTVTGSGDYSVNATATLTPMPKIGHRFVRWNDGNTDNPRYIVVTQDVTLTAQFEAVQYRVTVISSNSSMGTVSGGGDYNANSIATISANAYSGYRFVQWNDGNTQATRNITVVSDTSFAATFEPTYAITDIELTSVAIYPNPARDNINIILPDNVSTAVFTLYDMQGKVLIRQNINNEDVVLMNHLATGIYIYNIRTEKQNYQGKLIKQ